MNDDEKTIFKATINKENYCATEKPEINLKVWMGLFPRDKLILRQALKSLFLELLRTKKITIEQLAEDVIQVKNDLEEEV